MEQEDPVVLAEEAGLMYADASMEWRRRIRRGRGFSYTEPDGSPASDDVKAWVKTLAIPPAWNQVKIASREDSHILATGQDRAGRKQYIYHPDWEDIRHEVKFARMWEFGRRIARLRKQVDADLRQSGLPRSRVVALAVAVLDRTLIRVGNRRSAQNGAAYGLTTLKPDHVDVNGSHVHFEFTAKGGDDSAVVFRDRRLASLISRCEELSGQTLFSYSSNGEVASIGSADVNSYLAETMGGRFTAKDFRTWGASTIVAGELARSQGSDPAEQILEAVDIAAERLGNTRGVCRSSYVHPTLFEAFSDGRLEEAWRRSRSGLWLQRAESAVVKLSPAQQPNGPGS